MYSVWAPKAKNVDVVVDGTSHPMTAGDDGWFTCDIPATDGARYGFSVDGGPVVPDPRSRRQPDGIHGLSQVWHGSADLAPLGRDLQGEVLYEMHVGTFTPDGTLDSAIEKLDYLADLGVTAVELMPLQPCGGTRNWGYDGVCWHAVAENYGGPDALERFVAAAHDRGLAVVLDVVFNHFGPDGNYTGMFGPYTAGGSTGWGEVVNLQGPDSDEVRAYILEAVRIWTEEFGVDGLRLDAVHALDDTGAVSLVEQIRDVAEPSWVIAETDQNDPKYTEAFRVAQWNDDVHHAIHAAVSGEDHAYYGDFGSVEVLATTFQRVFWHDGRYSSFRRRTHGRPVSDPDYWRFVTYTTTHDQTGNRAAGDRPSMNLTVEQQIAKATLVLTSPFTPMLFMGEEWGASTPFAFFVDHESKELNEGTRQGRTREFARAGWDPKEVPDPAALETFLDSKLKWSELDEPDHARVLAEYRRLLDLRRRHQLDKASLVDISWFSEDPADRVDGGVNPTVPPVDHGSGRWIELTYEAPESEVVVRVNLGAGSWESTVNVR